MERGDGWNIDLWVVFTCEAQAQCQSQQQHKADDDVDLSARLTSAAKKKQNAIFATGPSHPSNSAAFAMSDNL